MEFQNQELETLAESLCTFKEFLHYYVNYKEECVEKEEEAQLFASSLRDNIERVVTEINGDCICVTAMSALKGIGQGNLDNQNITMFMDGFDDLIEMLMRCDVTDSFTEAS